ncbi:acyltransferase [Sphingomonas sp. 1P06PA]|uniref:acyltransferase family protein n=1 Tax=Sphingomonas sp. 1P06PA TaxID=554121 RepID=UPI0039A44A19
MTRHYRTLDGLRGIAAIAVVCMHSVAFFGTVQLPHAYLAVDLFFALSGLVIAHAYGAKLDAGMGTGAFMTMRLVRLYPLYLLGTAIGIAFFVVATKGGIEEGLTPAQTATAVAASLLMLPSPIQIGTHHWLTPFNFAGWSLMFELGVNLLMALVWRWLRLPFLAGLILFSGVWLIWWTMTTGHVDVGASLDTMANGVPRTLFSFFVGVALYHVRRGAPIVTGWAWALPIALIPLFAVPRGIGPWFDLLCVLLLFPIVIELGARIEPVKPGPFAWLGLISFAIYALHSPLLPIADTAMKLAGIPHESVAPWGGIVLVCGLIVTAILADLWYDRPVRRWLGRLAGTPRSAAS